MSIFLTHTNHNHTNIIHHELFLHYRRRSFGFIGLGDGGETQGSCNVFFS